MNLKILIIPFLVLFLTSEGLSQKKRKKRRKRARKFTGVTKVLKTLYDKKFYYAAKPAIFKLVKKGKITKTQTLIIKKILKRTGYEDFEQLDIEELKNLKLPITSYLIAKKYFYRRKFKEANIYAKKVPTSSRLFPQAQMLRGQIYNFKKEYNNAMKSFRNCRKTAYKYAGQFDQRSPEWVRYEYLGDLCQISIARVLYKAKNYKKSRKVYQSIPKNSYLWPSILYEDAWNSYMLKDYNKALGRLITYQAPVFEDYMYPEAEALKAVSYIRLCLWGDAFLVIDEFKKIYNKDRKRLRGYIKVGKNKKKFWIKFIRDKVLKEKISETGYIRSLIKRLKNGPYYLGKRREIFESLKEKKRVRSLPKRFRATISKSLSRSKARAESQLADFVKNYFDREYNKLLTISKNLETVRLEGYARKKEQLYQRRKLGGRNRGNETDIERTTKQYYWIFYEEFWADELGDYVLNLQSKCVQDDKVWKKKAKK